MSPKPVPPLHIRPFRTADQQTARAVVLAGMQARWGELDLTLNPDLNDIQASYIALGHHFFVGTVDSVIVATCALMHEGVGEMRIVRMSVQEEYWGLGFGRKLTQFLIDLATELGCTTLHVETNAAWTSAIHLYQNAGFRSVAIRDGENHMLMRLNGASDL